MIEPVDKKFRVYYNVLEADKEGKIPSFDSESKTGLQIIADQREKVSIISIVKCKRYKPLAKRELKILYLVERKIVQFV